MIQSENRSLYTTVNVVLITALLAACGRQTTATPQAVLPEGTSPTPIITPTQQNPTLQPTALGLNPTDKIYPLTQHVYPLTSSPPSKSYTECRLITKDGTAIGATYVLNNTNILTDVEISDIYDPNNGLFGVINTAAWAALPLADKLKLDETYDDLQPGSKACANYIPTALNEPPPTSPYSTPMPTPAPGQTASPQAILSSPLAPQPSGENCVVANGNLDAAKALGPDPSIATDASRYSIHYSDGSIEEYVTPSTVELGAWGLKQRITNDPGAQICFYGPGAR